MALVSSHEAVESVYLLSLCGEIWQPFAMRTGDGTYCAQLLGREDIYVLIDKPIA